MLVAYSELHLLHSFYTNKEFVFVSCANTGTKIGGGKKSLNDEAVLIVPRLVT